MTHEDKARELLRLAKKEGITSLICLLRDAAKAKRTKLLQELDDENDYLLTSILALGECLKAESTVETANGVILDHMAALARLLDESGLT